LLHATSLGFSALRAEPRLRRRALRTDGSEHNQNGKRFAQWHEFPLAPTGETDSDSLAQNTHGESNPVHFSVNAAGPKTLGPHRFAQPAFM